MSRVDTGERMSHYGVMRSRLVLPAIALSLVFTACGSDDNSTDGATTASGATEAPAATAADSGGDAPADVTDESDTSSDESASDDSEAADDSADTAADSPTGGGGTAVLTLFDGQEYEFSVLCMLEPQMAAGSEILFTAVSYDDPSLDITQFGDEGTITGVGSVTVTDSNFETLWEASTSYEAFGGSLELTLDGSTITGQGDFYPNADPTMDPVPGTVQANC